MILHYESLPSTQDYALDIVRQGRTDVEAVRADEQTAGRGRREADWHSPAGQCLAISYILWNEPVPGLPWALGMRMALTCAIAIEGETSEATLLRWPNDILMARRVVGPDEAGPSDRPEPTETPSPDGAGPSKQPRGRVGRGREPMGKVAGILVETVEGVAVIGVGINVNVTEFPLEIADRATSLKLVTGRDHKTSRLEAAIRAAFAATTWEEAIAAFRERDATTGKRFRASDGREGKALTIDEIGLLRIRWDDGTEETIPAAQPI